MKKEYSMPEMVITSFEADSNIMNTSGVAYQNGSTLDKNNFGKIKIGSLS